MTETESPTTQRDQQRAAGGKGTGRREQRGDGGQHVYAANPVKQGAATES